MIKEGMIKEVIIALIITLTIELFVLILIIIIWAKDCKKFGEENLAVPLDERIFTYCFWIVFPSVTFIIMQLFY